MWRMPLSQNPSTFRPAFCARSSIIAPTSPSSTSQAVGRSANRKGRPRRPISGTIWLIAPWLLALTWMIPAVAEVSISASSPMVEDGAWLTLQPSPAQAANCSAQASAAT